MNENNLYLSESANLSATTIIDHHSQSSSAGGQPQFDAACILPFYVNEAQTCGAATAQIEPVPPNEPYNHSWPSTALNDISCLYPSDLSSINQFQPYEPNSFNYPVGYQSYPQSYPAFNPQLDVSSGFESSQWNHFCHPPPEQLYNTSQLGWTVHRMPPDFTPYLTPVQGDEQLGDVYKKKKRDRDAKRPAARVNTDATLTPPVKRGRKPRRLDEPVLTSELTGQELGPTNLERADSNCSLTNDLEGFALNNHFNLPLRTPPRFVQQPRSQRDV